MVGALIRSIFEQPDADQVHAQHTRVVEQLHDRFGDAADMLVDAEADILAFHLPERA
jgi:putative transposase